MRLFTSGSFTKRDVSRAHPHCGSVSTSSVSIAGHYSGYRCVQINYVLFVQYGHLVCSYLLAFRPSLIAQLAKNRVCKVGKESVFNSWIGKTCWRKDRLPTPVFLGFSCGYNLPTMRRTWNYWASFVAQLVRNSPAMWGAWIQSLGWEDPLQKGKATHSSILPWRIPWTIWPMGLQRVRHIWATFT